MDARITIIGAGVVGLAIAKTLSEKYKDVFLLERNKKFGQETSSRNSEVIHSGVYYPVGSLKSILCVRGAEMLYKYCEENRVSYKKCGKIIAATTNEESQYLENIFAHAIKCGVKGGSLISKSETKKIEPDINAVSAIYFPSTGIIDSHGLMKQLETEALSNGAEVAYGASVIELNKITDGYTIKVAEAENNDYSFTSEIVINASGLDSFSVSKMIGIEDPFYTLYYWKGEYFSVHNGKNKLINRLIYPVPNHSLTGLGVHATIDLSGGLKLGPNAIFIENNRLDYSVNGNHREEFYLSAKKLMPFIEEDDLQPSQAGIRPKLQKPGDPVRDFIIKNEVERGYKNFINLIGIESPGLTASLAIAEYVKSIIV